MTNYKILTSPLSDSLEADMEWHVTKGWKAQGGVAVASDRENSWQYAVLMVKEEERGDYE